ncbi:hypothetical protein GQ457_08G035970 [Hibiscus cannabinus]
MPRVRAHCVRVDYDPGLRPNIWRCGGSNHSKIHCVHSFIAFTISTQKLIFSTTWLIISVVDSSSTIGIRARAQASTTTEAMSQSIDKPPYFNGAHYSHWKNRMMIFLQSVDYMLWDVIEDGTTIPMKRVGELHVPKEMHEWSNQERKKVQLNAKSMHILLCALGPEEFAKVSSCDKAKEIWDKLEVVNEGTNEVNETKIGLLNLNYENLKMDPNEDIKAMFNPFSIIVNDLKGFGEPIPEDKLVRKLIYSLPESWDSKKTTIIEAKNLKELKLDELVGSLLTHKLMSKPLIKDKEKKIKEQDINVNVISLKSSKCQYKDSSMEESSEEKDEEMEYLVKNFTRFMKSEKEKSKHESKKKKMKEPQRVQSSNKRGSTSKKAYVATWSDEEDSTENEVARLCFMALQVGEVTSNSSSSNSYTFDELQDAYDELVFEFKASFSKNKKLISKLKLENERLSKTNLEFEAKLKEYEIDDHQNLQNLLQTLEKDHQNEIDDLKNKNELISVEMYVLI